MLNKTQNKVTIFIQGGLCNQLFQIAAVLHYSKKFGHQPIFLGIKNLPNYTGELRYTYWNILNNNKQLLIDNINYNNFKIYKEIDFSYSEFMNINTDIMLYGYYQSDKYVNYVKNEMNELIFSNNIINNLSTKLYQEIVSKFKTDNLISLHIRRGDYLKLSDIHTNLPIEYYINGIKIISEKKNHNEIPIIVFSNDKKWCFENLRKYLHNNIYIVDNINCEYSEFVELLLMSKIKNNIIANSSFSWWATWLNKHNDSITIAPKKWFGIKGPKNWNDIYCKNWILID